MNVLSKSIRRILHNPNSVVYTDLKLGMGELHRRRQNIKFRKQTIEKLQLTPELAFLLEEPHLVFFRQIVTPSHEFIRVIDSAKEAGIKPVFFETPNDKFVAANNCYKKSLGKLPIYTGTNPHADDLFKYRTIVDFPKQEGKPIRQVQTVTEAYLESEHRELFNYIIKDASTIRIADISNWLYQFGHKASEYYYTYLHLFLTEAILAEIYLTSGAEEKLTKEIIKPAIKDIHSETKHTPLIWHYLPKGEDNRFFWNCYPTRTDEFLNKKGYYS